MIISLQIVNLGESKLALGKEKARVFDYVDSRVGVLKAAAKARKRVYAQ